MKTCTPPQCDETTQANARAVATAIDHELFKGRAVADVLSDYKGVQVFWLETARPFCKTQLQTDKA